MDFDPLCKKRRFFLKSAALGLSGMLLPSLGNSRLKKSSLSIGYLPVTDAAPLLIAHALGYFSQEGLVIDKPVMVRSWKVLTESFLTGKFDLTHMLFPIPIWMRFKHNIPVKVLAWNHTNGSAITVRGDSDIKSFNNLKGKQMAVPSWYSMHNLILQLGIKTQGLRPVIKPQSSKLEKDEVNLFILSPPEMPTALLGGKIDGFIVAEPFNALAQLKLKARIMRFSGDIWKDHPCCVIVCNEDLVSRDSSSVQKAINAIVRAQLWCTYNPKEAAYLLSRDGKGYLPVSQKVLEQVFSDPLKNDLKHPEWDIKRIGFQPYPFPSATEFIIKQMKETVVEGNIDFLDKLNPTAATEELVDDSFVLKAIDEIGGIKKPFLRKEVVEIN
ncbi:MAG: ABC transporter substrate-binding protein [Desulfobacteraceae bacterium]|nr:ABC transporter substrate-binding protein [Desulfobacteraceae bacterium]